MYLLFIIFFSDKLNSILSETQSNATAVATTFSSIVNVFYHFFCFSFHILKLLHVSEEIFVQLLATGWDTTVPNINDLTKIPDPTLQSTCGYLVDKTPKRKTEVRFTTNKL